jgi:hypothetical protein
MTEAELQAVIKTQAAELEQHRAASAQTRIDGAIREAAGGANLVPGSLDQFVALARPDFSIVNDQVVNRSLEPVGDAVKKKLADPSFSHFIRTAPSATPTASKQPPGPFPGLADVPTGGGPTPLPGEGPGQFWIRSHQERRAAAPTDARLDMSSPFGLRTQK